MMELGKKVRRNSVKAISFYKQLNIYNSLYRKAKVVRKPMEMIMKEVFFAC